MPTHPEFRFATIEDVLLIRQFISELAAYERLSHECVVTNENLEQTLFGARPYAEVVFAFVDSEPVGFALFFHNFSTFLGKPGLYLEDLFVRPHARGKGVGKALMRHLAKIALERGCGRFEWWVLDWNEPSIEFYKTLGALSMDEWTVMRVTGDSLTALATGP
jgi:GNAT superfamily N-acetyltransferase